VAQQGSGRARSNVAALKADYSLKSLQADPRWNALLKKVGLPTGP